MSGYTTENDRGDNDADGDNYTKSFYIITSAPENRTTATRHEVYANLDIVCADKPGIHDLKLKVATGASGNTLPVRKYKFYVVDVDGPAILGLRACEQMHIVMINAIKSSTNCPASVGKA